MAKTPRRALVLAGGGMKVGYQAGAMQVLLDEAGLEFAHADGTSGGCLNLAMLQSGLSGTRIANNWRATGPFELTSLQPLHRYLKPWRLPAFLSFDRLLRQLGPWGVDFGKIQASQITGTYNVYDFTAKELRTFGGPDMTPELFCACFALPIWFPSVKVGGTTYIDGVFWKDANLTEAVRLGADEIWVIWTVSETPDTDAGPYLQYFDIIEAVADGRFYEELREIERINEAVRAGADTTHREITVHVIRHPTPVPLDYLLFFSAGDMSRIVDMGVRDARAYLEQAGIPRRSEGPLGPPIGMRFIEQMHGFWMPGETDHEAGAAAGREEDSTLGVTLSIAIENLDDFLVDDDRTAYATGSVHCPALGGRLAVGSGSFNVLRVTGQDEREMRYTLPFRGADGVDYLFVGIKHVKDDPGFDAWADTTTLYVTIYRGTAETDPVAGTGIIVLRLADLVRQATTFRVLQGADPVARIVAILGFARYFAGALWQTFRRWVSSAVA